MAEDFWADPNLIQTILKGDFAVIPTDTILGVVCTALNKDSVENLYLIRKRDKDKPFIILISSYEDLKKFGIELTELQKNKIMVFSDKPTSFVLDVEDEKLHYLHRGKNSLAFRVPKNKNLVHFLREVGPIVAPSANTAGNPVSQNENEAREYFGDKVSFYSIFPPIGGNPSRIVHLYKDASVSIIRE